MIRVPEDNSKGGKIAVKVHRESEPYLRERAVYERLKSAGVPEVLGFNVPKFIREEDDLRVMAMSIVTRPFVLDFAGAFLDAPPDFPEEIWVDWESGKRELFEDRWPKVEKILAALEELDIYMVDVPPSNVAFLD